MQSPAGFAYLTGKKEHLMRKVTLVFGLLAGAAVSVFGFIITALCANGAVSFDHSDFLGYGSMIIALSMIFFGVKSYRDNYLNGKIKFGKAMQVGMLIALVATLLYTIANEAYYQIDSTGQAVLMNKYADYHLNKMKERNAPFEEIAHKLEELNALKEMHKQPVPRLLMTVAIILPVGAVIALFSAAVLKKKRFLPA